MINLEWYRSFITVYRVGTVSGAAKVLHLTQPAVSQHLAALESALEQQLFKRTPRKMVPTTSGRLLFNHIAKAIEQLESVNQNMSPIQTPQLIRVGTPREFFTERILPRLLSDDNYQYILTFGLPQDLIAQLLEDKLDFAISTVKTSQNGLVYKALFQENFWLVMPKKSAVPNFLNTSMQNLDKFESWLQNQPMIAYRKELPIIKRFWQVVFGHEVTISPKLIIPDLLAIRSAVESGLGWSVLPDYLCQQYVQENKLKTILQPIQSVRNDIWLVFRNSEVNQELAKFLLELVRQS